MENSSGLGKDTVVPEEVKGWNWGAFLFTAVWGLFNGTYWALLALLPFVGIIMKIVLGIKGSEWAWRNKKWQSVEHFKTVQRKWAYWSVGLLGGAFLLGLLAALIAPHLAG